MTEPHDRPTAAELVEAVREFIENEVSPVTEGRIRFHLRVAVNVLGMVERELEVGHAQAVAHAQRLAKLGASDDRALAAAIRAGEFDDRADELLAALSDAVADKVAVANPGYTRELSPRGGRGER